MPDTIAMAAVVAVGCLLAWDVARRWLAIRQHDTLKELRADIERHKEQTDEELDKLRNKLAQVGNRVPTQRAARLTGLGGR